MKPRKLIENCPGSTPRILCTCRTRKSKNYFLKIIFSMRFSSIDSSTSYYGPVSTMTTKFFENSKINFTIQQINQLNYNFLSMDLSTSAHAMTSLLSFWKHGADTMSALLSSPSSNHLPLSRDEVESIHNDETTFVNTVRTSTEVLRASSQTPRGQGLRDSVPLPPQTSFCSP